MTTQKSNIAALIGPALVIIAVFMGLPLCIMAVYSVLEPAQYGGVIWNLSPEAYLQTLFERDFLTDDLVFSGDYLKIFARSVLQAGIATVLCLIIGIPTAYYIATRPERQKNIWLFAVTIPYWVNLLIRTIALLMILRDDGPVNTALISIGLTETPLPLAYNNFAIGVGLAYSFLPFMILPLYSAFERFDFSLMEAAYDLHASRTQAFFKVVLPILKPGIVAGSLLVFIPGIGSYLAPDILGGGKTMMIGNLIGLQFQGSRNWPFGAALSMVLLSLTLLVLVWSARRSARQPAQGRHDV